MNKSHYDEINEILCNACRPDLARKLIDTNGSIMDNRIIALESEANRLNHVISEARKHGEASESPFYEMMKLLNGEKK